MIFYDYSGARRTIPIFIFVYMFVYIDRNYVCGRLYISFIWMRRRSSISCWRIDISLKK